MKLLNFGSLNIDYVYKLNHFVEKGETISSEKMSVFCGGKGLNQSIALAKAGACVYHAGKIGRDGEILLNQLVEAGVDTSFVAMDEGLSGHAIIQVNDEGDNCIILFGGANQRVLQSEIDKAVSQLDDGDILLLQNEVNHLEVVIRRGKEQGAKIVLNPAPMDQSILELPLELVDILILNEVEGLQISGSSVPKEMIKYLYDHYPKMMVVLTLGSQGLMYHHDEVTHTLRPSKSIEVVDTTAAGDTFIGYFLTCLTKGYEVLTALTYARNASEICITRMGASDSIPYFEEVRKITEPELLKDDKVV